MERAVRERFDWSLVWLTVIISVVGLVNLYSATASTANAEMDRLFLAQFAFVLFGGVIAAIVAIVDYHLIERLAYFLYGILLVSLILVLTIGAVRQNARSWIALGPINVQPMEYGKLVLIIVLARYFSSTKKPPPFSLVELIPPLLLLLIPVGLIIAQPDLGGAILYFGIFGTIILFVGLDRRSLATVALTALATIPLAYFFLLSKTQQARISVFINPDVDPLGRGYNIVQSKIAIGAGELFGRGFLRGTQSKLKFLPAHHTDFIFSVLSEEWGFVGSVFTIVLFFGVIVMGLEIAHRARDRFGSLLAFGITAMFFCQIVVNLGGALGMLPVTGVTLPFLSYGGSSILVNFIAIGLLVNISMRRFSF